MFDNEKGILNKRLFYYSRVGYLLDDPFNDMTPAKVDEFEDSSQLRTLTASYIFCPKCGNKNAFSLSSSGSQLVYFCSRCSVKLNTFWDDYYEDEMIIANCRSCQQLTFKDLKYCISCGSQQRAVALKRSKAISSQIPDFTMNQDDELQVACNCCVYGLIDTIIGVVLGRSTQRRYRNWLIAVSFFMCIAIIIFLVLWFIFT